GSSSSVFSEIEYLITECKRERILLPTDIDTLVGLTRESRDAIDNLEIKRTLCHRDVIASNVLLEPEATHLCDYDRAGDDDPIFELAVLLSDAYVTDTEWQTALNYIQLPTSPSLFARLKLYAAADDLASALRCILYSNRTSVERYEYMKYAGWRLLKARWIMYDSRYSDWLENIDEIS